MSEQSEVKISDGNGNSIVYAQANYKGSTVTYSRNFSNVGKMLSILEDFVPHTDDILIYSYRKSGCHWLYEIIGILLQNKLEPLKEFKEQHFLESMCDIDESPNTTPRILNTHIRLKLLQETIYKKIKTLCLIRNPKSIAVSNYFHVKEYHDSYQYDGNFHDYIQFESACTLEGTWFEFVKDSYDHLKHRTNVLFLYYEEMLKDPVGQVIKIADFLELDRSKEFCKGVAQLASFKNMSTYEGKETAGSYSIEAVKKLFRKGAASDWKNHFTVAESERYDVLYKEQLQSYGELMERISFE